MPHRCTILPGSCRGLGAVRLCTASAISNRRRASVRIAATCAQNIKARWLIDIKYGVKLEAVALLQEWVRDIGGEAGLTPFNAQISSGAVGVPESRLELEVAFDDMAELELFWGNIPPAQHRAWSQRAQHVIVDGSPTWHVFRSVPALPPQQDAETTQAAASPSQGRPVQQQQLQFVMPEAGAARQQQAEKPQQQQAEPTEEADDYDGPVDWKGDPMTINPGDRMPFF